MATTGAVILGFANAVAVLRRIRKTVYAWRAKRAQRTLDAAREGGA